MSDYGPAVARALSEVVYDKAGAFMLSPTSADLAERMGYPDVVGFYVAGRLGALGDAVPEAVAAAHGFLNSELAREAWPALGSVADRATAAEAFAGVCADYAESRLAEVGADDARRLAVLAERVVDAAPPTPLFAAWRALPRPTEPRARAAHALNLLREWRGGVHIAAVAAQGLTPLEAIMSDGGEFYAQAFGWPEPWPPAGGEADAIAEVSVNVDSVCGRFIGAVLSRDEAQELVDLAREVCSRL